MYEPFVNFTAEYLLLSGQDLRYRRMKHSLKTVDIESDRFVRGECVSCGHIDPPFDNRPHYSDKTVEE